MAVCRNCHNIIGVANNTVGRINYSGDGVFDIVVKIGLSIFIFVIAAVLLGVLRPNVAWTVIIIVFLIAFEIGVWTDPDF